MVGAEVDHGRRDSGAVQGHRADIDGLRALAVLAVVLYHLDIPIFGGGFVGVDAFFVISGFLITGIIVKQFEAGSFSFLDFYRRRARRILPALTLVLLSTTVVASVVLFDGQFEDFSHSLIAAATFSSNFYFASSVNYFTASVESIPLLHIWSLAVEEQFYLLFPVIVFVIFRYSSKPRLLPVILLLLICSFIASSALVLAGEEGQAFYQLPSRAWELLIGSLMAVWNPSRHIRRLGGSDAVAGASLLGLVLSICFYSSRVPFPGPAAAVPVVATALLISTGATSRVGRLLSLQPLRWVGLISYSLYLWHWPVIALYRSWHPTIDLSASEQVSLLLAATVLAALTYRFVETPGRRLRLNSPKRLVGFTASVTAILLLVGWISPALVTYTDPKHEKQNELAAWAYDPNISHLQSGTCFISSANSASDFDEKQCLRRSKNRVNVLLVGDSFGADMVSALRVARPTANIMQATASGCEPILSGRGESRCTSIRDLVFEKVLPAGDISEVVLSAHWTERDLAGLPATLQFLERLVPRVTVIGPRPLYSQPLPNLLARSVSSQSAGVVRENRMREPFVINREMSKITRLNGAFYVSLVGLICSSQCTTLVDGDIPLQFDYGHFTRRGSEYVGFLMRET